MTFPAYRLGFSLYQSAGPRGEVAQDQATLIRTSEAGALITETAGGSVEPGHPIDQGTVMALTVPLGSIKSAPTVGNTLHLTDIAAKSLENDIRQRVRAAFPLSRYLADGSVTIRMIRHEVRANGGLLVSVDYRNELTGKNETATN